MIVVTRAFPGFQGFADVFLRSCERTTPLVCVTYFTTPVFLGSSRSARRPGDLIELVDTPVRFLGHKWPCTRCVGRVSPATRARRSGPREVGVGAWSLCFAGNGSIIPAGLERLHESSEPFKGSQMVLVLSIVPFSVPLLWRRGRPRPRWVVTLRPTTCNPSRWFEYTAISFAKVIQLA